MVFLVSASGTIPAIATSFSNLAGGLKEEYSPNSRTVQQPSVSLNRFVSLLASFNPHETRVAAGSGDLNGTEAEITPEIADLATRILRRDPVSIFQFVYQNISYAPYFGSVQGSEETLLSGAGNDLDQSSLMIALLRAAEIPARYAVGTMWIPREEAINWLGVKVLPAALRVFEKAQIPAREETRNGQIGVSLAHAWVEASIGGDWKSFDPSFKQYDCQDGLDIAPLMDPTQLISSLMEGARYSEDESWVTSLNDRLFSEKIRERARKISDFAITEGMPIDRVFGHRTVRNRDAFITHYENYDELQAYDALPGILRLYWELRMGHDELRENRWVTVWDRSGYNASVPDLVGKRITIGFVAPDKATQDILMGADSVDKLPASRIKLAPVLSIDGEVVLKGVSVPLGTNLWYKITMILGALDMRIETPEWGRAYCIVGGLCAIAISAQQSFGRIKSRIMNQPSDAELESLPFVDWTVGEALYLGALEYFSTVERFSELIAKALGVVPVHYLSWGALQIDLAPKWELEGNTWVVRRVWPSGLVYSMWSHPIDYVSKQGLEEEEFAAQLADNVIGSYLESDTLEALFGIPSLSTSQILLTASNRAIPIYLITKENVRKILPRLKIPDSEMYPADYYKDLIRKEVDDGHIVLAAGTGLTNEVLTIEVSSASTPHHPRTYSTWSGFVLKTIDPKTGQGHSFIGGNLPYSPGGVTGYFPLVAIPALPYALPALIDYGAIVLATVTALTLQKEMAKQAAKQMIVKESDLLIENTAKNTMRHDPVVAGLVVSRDCINIALGVTVGIAVGIAVAPAVGVVAATVGVALGVKALFGHLRQAGWIGGGSSSTSSGAKTASSLAPLGDAIVSTDALNSELSVMLVGPDGNYQESTGIIEALNLDPGTYTVVVTSSSQSTSSYDIYVELSSEGKTLYSTTYADVVQPKQYKALTLESSLSTSGDMTCSVAGPPSEVSIAYLSFDAAQIEGYPVVVEIDGTRLSLRAGSPKVFAFPKDVSMTVKLHWPSAVMVGADTRYYLESTARTLSTSGRVDFTLVTQYVVSITSPYRAPKGSGWYDEGSEAEISIEPSVELANGTRMVFAGWRGDLTANTSEHRFRVDGPKKVEATWKAEAEVEAAPTTLYIAAVVAAAVAAIAGVLLISRFRARQRTKRSSPKTIRPLH